MGRVVVIGSSNTDLTVRVPVLPERGQTRMGESFHSSPGGKGANQALAAKRAGAEVSFVAAVGNDPEGLRAIELYRREGIHVSHMKKIAKVQSGVALIVVDDYGENLIVVAPGANDHLTPDVIERLPKNMFKSYYVLATVLEIPFRTVAGAVRRASKAGMTVVLNPAPPGRWEHAGLLAMVDVLTPNRDEAQVISGMTIANRTDASTAAKRILRMGAKAIVVTMGEMGCLLVSDELERWYEPHDVKAIDTVGAGDAFCGALAAALARQATLEDAVAWANAAAGLAVTVAGAQQGLAGEAAINRQVRFQKYEKT